MRRILGAWPRKTAFALLIAAWSGGARPEVTLDGSLSGPSRSLPGPEFKIRADFGRQVGSNLFHSFDAFNLNASESATFNDVGASGLIENILSRVTGPSASNIDGMLGTDFDNATPNLFLLNPHGIVFGPTARLDVQGSFHASTGDFIRLEDGTQFDAAVSSGNDALLTTARPQAFGFLRDSPALIGVQGSRFAVPEGETLSIIGGDIDLPGGARLRAPGGQVNVASVASAGEVTLGGAELGTGSFARLGKIGMTQGSIIDVSEARNRATGGGRVLIRGGQLVMDNSEVSADTKNGPGKGIDIRLTNALEMNKRTRIHANTTGAGNGGDLQVEAQDILLDGSNLSAKNDAKEASGDAGEIVVQASRLRLTRGGLISVNTDGPGLGGNIVIEAGEVVLEEGLTEGKKFIPSAISAITAGRGRGGDITIRAGHLRLTKGAQIRVSTEGRGQGGHLTIKAGDIVLEKTIEDQDQDGGLDRPTILARSEGEAKHCGNECGDGGNITIEADRLHLKDGAEISARTVGPGKGGSLSIRANEVILENGIKRPDPTEPGQETVAESSLNATAEGKAADCGQDCGDGGSITVKADRLQLKQGAAINVSTDGSGRSGNITIKADEVVLEGRFDSSVREGGFEAVLSARTRGKGEGSGDGGNITIKAGRLQLKDDAAIRADTLGPGKGGAVSVDADRVLLSGDGSPDHFTGILAVAETDAAGDAGSVTVKARELRVSDGAQITTSTLGDADAGRIDVKAETIKLVNRGRIASASGSDPDAGEFFVGTGDAGRVSIDAKRLEISERGSITTTTRGPGRGGAIEVTAADLELRDGASITSESISENPDARSGGIFIRASDSFRLFNDSHVSVETNGADAGDIDLDVGFLLHLRDSSITTSVAGGEGRGGNINIDPVFVVLDNSKIMADAFGGPGGNVHIFADHFFASPDSVVSASSALGIDGVVEIESPDTDLNAGLVELPADFFDAATLLTQGCAPGADLSRLVVRKYEVLPDSPAALRVPPPGGLLNANAQDAGFALTPETLGPGFEHSSDCDGDG